MVLRLKGKEAVTKGFDRMIDQPKCSAKTMTAILAPHRKRTLQRMRARPIVLCIQGGTDLKIEAESAGLHLRSTFVVGTDALPLGIVAAQCPAAQPKSKEAGTAAIAGLRDCISLAEQLPDTRQVCVMDCQADYFELFDEQRAANAVHLLVRAQPDSFAHVRQSDVRAGLSFLVASSRPKNASREAMVALRYEKIELHPPAGHKAQRPLAAWVIHACETTTPVDAKPLEWFLLTTIDITAPAQAAECLRWYGLLGRIDDWHRVLKTGCRIEELQPETDEELRRAIAIKLVIAWRIMLMTLLGRPSPELPAETLFSDIEIEVLRAFAKKKHFKNRYDAARLGDAVRLVAYLGGYLGRANDPTPGHEILWRGYTTFQKVREGYELLRSE